MVMHMRDDLRRGRAVILHNVPVVDARGARNRLGQHADLLAQRGGLLRRRVCEFGAVRPRADEDVTAREGEDVEKGHDGGRGEDEEGRRRGEVAGDGGWGGCGVVGAVDGGNGAERAGFALFGRFCRIKHAVQEFKGCHNRSAPGFESQV